MLLCWSECLSIVAAKSSVSLGRLAMLFPLERGIYLAQLMNWDWYDGKIAARKVL